MADLELYHYSILIERVRLSSRFARRAEAGNVFPFDAHYRLAGSHCQQLSSWPRTVPRLVGALCPRNETGGGEDHACWMATLFTPLPCPGFRLGTGAGLLLFILLPLILLLTHAAFLFLAICLVWVSVLKSAAVGEAAKQ